MSRNFKEIWMEQDRTLVDKLLAFKEIQCNIFSWLNEDEVSEDALLSHNVKWHDNCRLHINKTEEK